MVFIIYGFYYIRGNWKNNAVVPPYYSRTWYETLIKFEFEFVLFWFYKVQNDLPSERKSFLRVPGLESFDFDEFLMKIVSKTKFEKITKN